MTALWRDVIRRHAIRRQRVVWWFTGPGDSQGSVWPDGLSIRPIIVVVPVQTSTVVVRLRVARVLPKGIEERN